MSERDDIDDLLDDLSETLDALQRELPAGELAPRPPRPPRRRGRRTPRDSDTDGSEDADGGRGRGPDRGRAQDRDRSGDRDRPRLPGPGEFLRFTEEYTIPTLIAMLEATIKSLELLRAVLRVAGGRGFPSPSGSRGSRRSRGRDVVSDTGRRALDSLDGVLADLSDAIEGQPTDPRARDLLDEARDLRQEIDGMISGRTAGGERADGPERSREDHGDAAASEPGDRGDRGERADRSSRGVTIDVGDGPRGTANDGGTDESREDESDADVDVDAELDTIKREMGKDVDAEDGDGAAEDGDGAAGDAGADDGGSGAADASDDESP